MGKSKSDIKFDSSDWTSGDSHSCRLKETDAVVNRSLVQTSNGEIDAQSEVSKLPVELLSLIFQHCDPQIRPRLDLTHTCRQWRLIAVNYPRLWTDIYINTYIASSSNATHEHFESLLSMQVDRSDRLLLDVIWIADFEEDIIRCLHTIENKAPFSRWRSLEISGVGRNSHAESVLTSLVEFPNLESLTISRGTGIHLANIFCRAAVPKLQMLDLRMGDSWAYDETESLNNGLLFIPGSIITLRAGARNTHPFPNILNYKLKQCVFRSDTSINLRSMTNLIIDGCLYIYEECDILLPALRHLSLMSMVIYSGGKIEAPFLQTLHISASVDRGDLIYTSHTQRRHVHYSFNEPGYHLSPKKLIICEPSFSTGSMIEVLKKSPELTQATLSFDDRASAQGLVEALFESSTGNTPPDERLCPHLGELLLDCEWDGDMPLSAEQWGSGLETREDNLPGTRVSIKARRRGEERYQLLAEW
jgi:F-box-like